MSYLDEAESDAQEMVENFRDEIEEQLVDDDEASSDVFNDYQGAPNTTTKGTSTDRITSRKRRTCWTSCTTTKKRTPVCGKDWLRTMP